MTVHEIPDYRQWVWQADPQDLTIPDSRILTLLGVQTCLYGSVQEILFSRLDQPDQQLSLPVSQWLEQAVPEVQARAWQILDYYGQGHATELGRAWQVLIPVGDRTAKENLDELLDDVPDIRSQYDWPDRLELQYAAEHDYKILTVEEIR